MARVVGEGVFGSKDADVVTGEVSVDEVDEVDVSAADRLVAIAVNQGRDKK